MKSQEYKNRLAVLWSSLICTSTLVLLSACGGGGGSGSAGGGSQQPDAVAVDLPVAYVKRLIPVDEDENPVYPDLLNPEAFNPGAELFVKARAAATAAEVNITAGVFPPDEETPTISNYDVKDLSTSADGKKLLFSMRAPEIEDADEDEQPTWNIWEYDLTTKTLHRLIASDLVAERGDDVTPIYLADGSILFASNRQTRSREILLDEGKPSYQSVTEDNDELTTFLLHKMRSDGTEVQQISFNLSHDFQPILLQNGRVLFSRWVGTQGQQGNEQIVFYTAKPDGTDVQYFFGNTSLNTASENDDLPMPRLFRPQELPDGRIAAIYMHNETSLGGDMVFVDPELATEGPIESISSLPILIDPELISLHGQFASLSPLFDGTNRLLVSWSPCRLFETEVERLRPCTTGLLVEGEAAEGHEAAPPLFGIWIYDLVADTQLPVVLPVEGYMLSEAVALENSSKTPDYIPSELDPILASENVGLLHIRSVYDLDGAFNRLGAQPTSITYDQLKAAPADQRPARFLRILKPIPSPDEDTLDDQDDNIYGNLMDNDINASREIIGYVPIEADGSVQTKVPSDISFTFEVVNRDGRRIQARHPVWITLRAGETRECHGCHDGQNTSVVHGREEGEAAALNAGASTSGVSFPNTQRYDTLGAPLTPNMGETMAEFAARSTYCEDVGGSTSCLPMAGPGQERNLKSPTVDVVYRDVWSAVGVTPTPAFDLSYNSMIPGADPGDIPAPVNEGCRLLWTPYCRIVINYEYHIQVLWEQDRGGFSCLGCHANADVNGNVMVPSGNLELGRAKAAADEPMLSYNQLTDGRNRQILLEGDVLTPNIPVCEFVDNSPDVPACFVTLDVDGNPTCEGVDPCPFEQVEETDVNGVTTLVLVLDDMGQPIPRTETQELPAIFGNSANGSTAFFNRFTNAGSSHYNYLNEHELRLISEFLDLNRNYYNNPFEMAIQQ
jgi:hypothetical protein